MKTYYAGKKARSYNQTWKAFSQKTLAATYSAIDFTRLQSVSTERGQRLHILDVACGTGLFLQRLADRFPDAELYGTDQSRDMLIQAQELLKDRPHTHFVQASLGEGKEAGLPYAPATFDLITCTNTFHYLKDPVGVLEGLKQLLIPQGQLVIEDYARRGSPFPWKFFEWFIRRIDPQHIRAFTLDEARNLCQLAGLQVETAKKFPIDLLWQGWVMSMLPARKKHHVDLAQTVVRNDDDCQT